MACDFALNSHLKKKNYLFKLLKYYDNCTLLYYLVVGNDAHNGAK